MTPLLLADSNFVLPFHSSNRYTPPLTVADAFICTGEVAAAPASGEQTFTPSEVGMEHAALEVEIEFPARPTGRGME